MRLGNVHSFCCCHLEKYTDERTQWKKSVQDIDGEVLCGTKPDFHGALGGDKAKELYQLFVKKVEQGYAAERVKDGVFQAMMEVALVNDGPVLPKITDCFHQ
ncbi:putative D-tyrosyl-tRNA(Tyr) deacylase [Glarea lozoyensis 74030]|uniref:D-aminoacyl-tRNA deacylase n=1 Tax=Glarea lozoyensis (strain ATCC 74030 / MF5533) TaxID=1104152 RepID=H0ESL8_GLAL7|nr:putative D-tyrosyl-tRNA(Tyr) deacylase [Glarea lozoyensis 74030]